MDMLSKLREEFRTCWESIKKKHFVDNQATKNTIYPHQQLIMDDLRHSADHIQIINWPEGTGKGRSSTNGMEPYTGDPNDLDDMGMDMRGLFRRKVADKITPGNTAYIYTCKCGTDLTEGPCGAGSINAVCKTCKINYGCLPGYYGEN
jgi:hypothetical protein